jgi:5-deoxy-5-amino-3-dehydroquinate synthase
VADHRRVIAAYDLSDRLPESHDHTELVALMGKDKKAVDGLTFVLDGPDGVEVVPGVDPLTAAVVLERMAAAGPAGSAPS